MSACAVLSQLLRLDSIFVENDIVHPPQPSHSQHASSRFGLHDSCKTHTCPCRAQWLWLVPPTLSLVLNFPGSSICHSTHPAHNAVRKPACYLPSWAPSTPSGEVFGITQHGVWHVAKVSIMLAHAMGTLCWDCSAPLNDQGTNHRCTCAHMLML